MKTIMFALVFVLALIGCTESNHEEAYIGNWTQVNSNGYPKMTAIISKLDNGYRVEISLPIPNQVPVIIRKIGQFEKGVLKVEGIENIKWVQSSGHLMIGVNEFELNK